MDIIILLLPTEYGKHHLKKFLELASDFLMNSDWANPLRRNSFKSSVNDAIDITLLKFCSIPSSHGNYGSIMHFEDAFMASTRGRNCKGPDRSESQRFLARLIVAKLPANQWLKMYRQAGEREFQETQCTYEERPPGSSITRKISQICVN